MLRSILGGIFASTLFLTTNATAQQHFGGEPKFFVYLQTKNGAPSGEFFSGSHPWVSGNISGLSALGTFVSRTDKSYAGSIEFSLPIGQHLTETTYETRYIEGDDYQSEREIRVKLEGLKERDQTFDLSCKSEEERLERVIISRLEMDPTCGNCVTNLKVDFSISCDHPTNGVTDFITGSIVSYETNFDGSPTVGDEAHVEMYYDAFGRVVSEVYTDATHNVSLKEESILNGGGYTVSAAPKYSPPVLGEGSLLKVSPSQVAPQGHPLPVLREVHQDPTQLDSILTLTPTRAGLTFPGWEGKTFIRTRLSDIAYKPVLTLGPPLHVLQTINLEYAVLSKPTGGIPGLGFQTPLLLAFGRVRLSPPPSECSSLQDEIANLIADNTSFSEQNTLLRDQNSKLEQSLSHERSQSQALREQLEKQKAETAKLQSERDDLAKKLDAANKEIRDLKLALDSSPQALRLARQRLAMAQSTIAKLTQDNSELTESLGTKTKELSSLRLVLKSLPPRLQVLSQVMCRNSPTCQRTVTQVSAEITRLANP